MVLVSVASDHSLVSLFASHRILRRSVIAGPRAGAAQDEQIVRDHSEADPPLHPREVSIPAAAEAVAALQGADAP